MTCTVYTTSAKRDTPSDEADSFAWMLGAQQSSRLSAARRVATVAVERISLVD